MRQIVRLRLLPVAYPDAAAALDRAECVLAIAIRRWAADFRHRIDPSPRLCRTMHTGGVHKAFAMAQAGDDLMAQRALRTTLLSAPGAEFALAPWQGLADLLAAALLFFRRGKPPGVDPAPLDAEQPWITRMIPETIH